MSGLTLPSASPPPPHTYAEQARPTRRSGTTEARRSLSFEDHRCLPGEGVGCLADVSKGRRAFRPGGTVRPAWARSSGCKSPAELATARQVKRNCVRVTERGKEAWSETVSRWTRTGYEALPTRASRLSTAKLLWPKVRWRKCGGCAVKDRVLTWGDLALCLKGRRGHPEREVSKGRSSWSRR